MARLAIPPLALLALALLTMSSVAEDTKEDTKLTPKALQDLFETIHPEKSLANVTTLVMKLSTLTSSFPAWYPTAMEQAITKDNGKEEVKKVMDEAFEKKKEICQTYNELVVVVNGLKMGQQQLKTWQAKLSTQLMSTDLGKLKETQGLAPFVAKFQALDSQVANGLAQADPFQSTSTMCNKAFPKKIPAEIQARLKLFEETPVLISRQWTSLAAGVALLAVVLPAAMLLFAYKRGERPGSVAILPLEDGQEVHELVCIDGP